MRASYVSSDYIIVIALLAQTTLSSVIGLMDLDNFAATPNMAKKLAT